ncbi:MAG TPA: hypothetical protein ACFYEK_13825 [Candidatus Wunengus sp. YC60]|uniref:hypothetical protein n=1 Tax=Candidatus Wunengus sp. YC60 TaxID=3367697 RepID=UPI0040264D4E
MRTVLSFTSQQYNLIRAHLFRGKKEQGCFLFATSRINEPTIELNIKDIHLIESGGWSYQNGCHLELDEKEKVKVMLKAREYDSDLIECHSHRFNGSATFSPSDVQGLEEFVQYVWWKLPNKLYGAVIFTNNDAQGQIWLPKQSNPLLINEMVIVDKAGKFKRITKVSSRKSFFNIFRRHNYD